MTKALKAQSTHKELGARLSVYDRLGISQPGFWVHQGKRKVEEPDDDFNPLEKTAPQYEGLQPLEPKEYDWGTSPRRTTSAPASAPPAAPAAAGGGSGGMRMPNLAANLKQQSNYWFANNRTATAGGRSISALDVGAAQRAIQMSEISSMLEGKGMQDISQKGLLAVSQYYLVKAADRAVARDNIPFGHGLPTQFEEMQAALGARAKLKPKAKGNTGGQTVQQILQGKVSQGFAVRSPTGGVSKPQLNVKQNGYASTYTGFHW